MVLILACVYTYCRPPSWKWHFRLSDYYETYPIVFSDPKKPKIDTLTSILLLWVTE